VISALDFFHPAVSNRETTASVVNTEGGMTILDALRQAERQGKESVHRGAEKLHHLETAIRRKVRGTQQAPTADEPEQRDSAPSSKVRTGIVSVNGRDVGEMRCTGGRPAH
jgi:hypothetical protein